MRRLAQSTSRVVTFAAFLSSDHISIATGKTIAVTISKNGGAFANPNAGATNATEIGSTGIYKVTLDTTDTNTLGDLWVHGAVATVDNVDFVCDVVSASTGGLTNLDAAISTLATQASVDDLPTNAELATALAAADDAVLAAIAGLPTAPTAIENADALLDRDMAAGVDSGSDSVRTPRQSLRGLRNKWEITGSTLNFYKEDDSTLSHSGPVTGSPGADPISSFDPTGP